MTTSTATPAKDKTTRIRLPDVNVTTELLYAHPRFKRVGGDNLNRTAVMNTANGRNVVYHFLQLRPDTTITAEHYDCRVTITETGEYVGVFRSGWSTRSLTTLVGAYAASHPTRPGSEERKIVADWKRTLWYAVETFVPMSVVDQFKDATGDVRGVVYSVMSKHKDAVANAVRSLDVDKLVEYLGTLDHVPPAFDAFTKAYKEAKAQLDEVLPLSSPVTSATVALLRDAIIVKDGDEVIKYPLDMVPVRYGNALAIRVMHAGAVVPGVGIKADSGSARIILIEGDAA